MSIFVPPYIAGASSASAESPYEVPQQRKSAGLSWILSLLLPGLGQYICGARGRGRVTFAFFVGAILVVSFGSGDFRWMGLRIALMIYAFAGMDAYLTAREHNRGMDVEASENPRIAAILNLTTIGFGYVYLGAKSALLIVVGVAITTRVLGAKLPLFAELFCIGLATHAWRMAAQERDSVYPSATPAVVETRLPIAFPIIVAALVVAPYYALVVYVQLQPLLSR
jgi:hypothetical protein